MANVLAVDKDPDLLERLCVELRERGVFSLPLGRRMEEVERRYILGTLEMLGNNKARSAQVLGISKKTLYRRLHDYGIPLGPKEADSPRATRAPHGPDSR